MVWDQRGGYLGWVMDGKGVLGMGYDGENVQRGIGAMLGGKNAKIGWGGWGVLG